MALHLYLSQRRVQIYQSLTTQPDHSCPAPRGKLAAPGLEGQPSSLQDAPCFAAGRGRTPPGWGAPRIRAGGSGARLAELLPRMHAPALSAFQVSPARRAPPPPGPSRLPPQPRGLPSLRPVSLELLRAAGTSLPRFLHGHDRGTVYAAPLGVPKETPQNARRHVPSGFTRDNTAHPNSWSPTLRPNAPAQLGPARLLPPPRRDWHSLPHPLASSAPRAPKGSDWPPRP